MVAASVGSLVSRLARASSRASASWVSGPAVVSGVADGSLAARVAGRAGLSRVAGSSGSAGVARLSSGSCAAGPQLSGWPSVSGTSRVPWAAGVAGLALPAWVAWCAWIARLASLAWIPWVSATARVALRSLGSVAGTLLSLLLSVVGRQRCLRAGGSQIAGKAVQTVCSVHTVGSSTARWSVGAGAAGAGLSGLPFFGQLVGAEEGGGGHSVGVLLVSARDLDHLLPHLTSARLAEVELELDVRLERLDVVEDEREGDQTARDRHRAEHDGAKGRLFHGAPLRFLVHR